MSNTHKYNIYLIRQLQVNGLFHHFIISLIFQEHVMNVFHRSIIWIMYTLITSCHVLSRWLHCSNMFSFFLMKSIWAYSGHYKPSAENLRNFMNFLEENGVDLKEVEVSHLTIHKLKYACLTKLQIFFMVAYEFI